MKTQFIKSPIALALVLACVVSITSCKPPQQSRQTAQQQNEDLEAPEEVSVDIPCQDEMRKYRNDANNIVVRGEGVSAKYKGSALDNSYIDVSGKMQLRIRAIVEASYRQVRTQRDLEESDKTTEKVVGYSMGVLSNVRIVCERVVLTRRPNDNRKVYAAYTVGVYNKKQVAESIYDGFKNEMLESDVKKLEEDTQSFKDMIMGNIDKEGSGD